MNGLFSAPVPESGLDKGTGGTIFVAGIALAAFDERANLLRQRFVGLQEQ